jgi:putative transposase
VKCAFIEQHRAAWAVATQCRVLGVSRARYYQWRQRPVSARRVADQQLTPEIRQVFAAAHARYGSPRVHRELQAGGTRVSAKRVARLMQRAGLRARGPRMYRVTTDAKHTYRVAPNTLARQFHVAALNRVWGADITFLPTREGALYLAVVLDLCSRRVIGWSLDGRIDQQLALRALAMARQLRGPCTGVLHHSDRGSQYASTAYQTALDADGIQCSMSRAGNCWDNAVVESFFATLKREIGVESWFSRDAARDDIVPYIEGWYNRRRRHSALHYLPPVAFEETQVA